MSKFAPTTAAGLAFAAGAEANIMFTDPGPHTLAANQSVTVFSGNGVGMLGVFSWSFDYAEPISDASWASDMAIDIMAPNGNSVRIDGFSNPGPVSSSYNGAGSTSPGNYGDSIDLSGFNLAGDGLWTVVVTNDWATDPNPNVISNFMGTLNGVVPTPGAVGLFGIAGLAAARRRR